MTELPSFEAFFTAINGRTPFPWQQRLADRVVASGWPPEIGVPTGLGKTACIDVGVWALAHRAGREARERAAPTRIWYVVNRRLLVDQAWAHGRHLAEMLSAGLDSEGQPSDVVREVGIALRSLTPLGARYGPLQISRLRGGAEIGARAIEPAQPAIMFSTVPMFASRWLFRGYATSTSMRPVDAALAGIDTLVLLDEAHLAQALLQLSEAVADCDIGDPSALIGRERSRPVIVALTATGEGVADRFDLDARDLDHPVVRQRIEAAKPTVLHESAEKSVLGDLARGAIELLDGFDRAASCVVFVNTPAAAREVARDLGRLGAKRPRGSEIVMATGRMRDREAEAVRRRLLDPLDGVPAGRRAGDRDRDLIVVATQTLEVGADLDFDALVTETAGRRALIQRFGRLNRLGCKRHAPGAIVHPSDRMSWPVYGSEPVEVWGALVAAAGSGELNLSPARIGTILGSARDTPDRVGELLPSHLWEWAKTSLPPPGEAPVGLFFEGFGDDVPRVSVCWRAHLPNRGVRLSPGLREAESVDVPLWELRDALKGAGVGEVRRVADDRASLETTSIDALRPGDEVVLPATQGFYDVTGWDPASQVEVLDASLLQAGVLPLTTEALSNLAAGFHPGEVLSRLSDEGEEGLSPEEERELVTQLLDHLEDSTPHPWLTLDDWVAFLGGFDERSEVIRPVDDVAYLAHLLRVPERVEIRADAFEELSFDVDSVALAEHLGVVGEIAAGIGRHLGLGEPLVASVKKAAEWHDLGKRDPRFQRWLDPEPDPESPRAKSSTPRHLVERERIVAQWPKGGRHELVSVAIAAEWLAWRGAEPLGWDPDLVVHLIAAHHGHGRPLVKTVGDPFPPSLVVEIDGTELKVASDLSRSDWEQPARFRALCERYGYWGLALLEAIVRQADHAASRLRGVV